MTYRIFSIDPSLNSTGICILSERGTVLHATAILHSLDDPRRLKFIYDTLKSLLLAYRPTHVVYERQIPQMRYNYSAGSMIPLAELAGILKLSILEYLETHPETKVYRIPPEDIKRYATGNNKAEKSQMMESVPQRAMKRIRYLVTEDSVNDASDAYHAGKLIVDLLKSDNGSLTVKDKEYSLSQYAYISEEVTSDDQSKS